MSSDTRIDVTTVPEDGTIQITDAEDNTTFAGRGPMKFYHTPLQGDFHCPSCHSEYQFFWDGQLWTFQLVDRYPGR